MSARRSRFAGLARVEHRDHARLGGQRFSSRPSSPHASPSRLLVSCSLKLTLDGVEVRGARSPPRSRAARSGVVARSSLMESAPGCNPRRCLRKGLDPVPVPARPDVVATSAKQCTSNAASGGTAPALMRSRAAPASTRARCSTKRVCCGVSRISAPELDGAPVGQLQAPELVAARGPCRARPGGGEVGVDWAMGTWPSRKYELPRV